MSKNTCPTCDEALSYFDRDGLKKDEANNAKNYQGKGTPRACGLWPRRKVFFDGSRRFQTGIAQFICATFLLFLLMFFIKFAIHIAWIWFCLCHGKTGDCGAGGGAVKHIADGYKN